MLQPYPVASYAQQEHVPPHTPSVSAQSSWVPSPSPQVTTTPDFSQSIQLFEDNSRYSREQWLKELECACDLPHEALRAVAISKLGGTARNWHDARGKIYDGCSSRKIAFQSQFKGDWNLTEWQAKRSECIQSLEQSLVSYTFSN